MLFSVFSITVEAVVRALCGFDPHLFQTLAHIPRNEIAPMSKKLSEALTLPDIVKFLSKAV